MQSTGAKNHNIELATFAGGCFWCIESAFRAVDGIIDVKSGYAGGVVANPTYEQVGSGRTGHLEAVQIVFDPKKIAYRLLLDSFWGQIDPTDAGGQFADRGPQYKTAIFYHSAVQRKLAEQSKAELEASGRYNFPIATNILPYKNFYPAEEYHQNYSLKNPERYEAYKTGSGRFAAAESPEPEQKNGPKAKLTEEQYRVTRLCQTEPPFQNEFWNNKRKGIYVDVVSGEPLFSSLDKFDSGTGWPSFTRAIDESAIEERADSSQGMERIEIRSKKAGSHLGHKFNDGPLPSGKRRSSLGQGMTVRPRYCVNSASLRFIPKEDLKKIGFERYKKYLRLFTKQAKQ